MTTTTRPVTPGRGFSERKVRHGGYSKYRPTPSAGAFRSWLGMRSRCGHHYDKAFERYGGRGIKVCERWRVFENFLADMGPRPPGTSLDRIDVNGNYEPGNCRWATVFQQQRNTRRTRYLTVDGVKRSLAEWAEVTGISRITIQARLRHGWTEKEAVETPPLRNGTAARNARIRKKSRKIEFRGCERTISEWASLTGIPPVTIFNRLRSGWTAERSLTEPVNSGFVPRDPSLLRRGENHRLARLTDEIVRIIRRARAAGEGVPSIARRLELPKECVRRAALRETWAHVS